MTCDELTQRVQDAATNKRYYISPTTLLILVQVILALVRVCWPKGPGRLNRTIRGRGFMARMAIRHELVKRMGWRRFRQEGGALLIHLVLDSAVGTEPEIVACYDLAEQLRSGA